MTAKFKHKPRSSALHSVRFPNENKKYRAARDKLLKAEIKLRKTLEDVAAMRRRLPIGGQVPEDYEFEEGGADLDDRETVRRVKLSDLFQPTDGSLIIYNFMYGPKMARPCPMCTSILDGLNGSAPHAMQRVNLTMVAKSPIQRIRDFARQRGWRNLRILSSAGNSYNRDYQGEDASGAQWPCLNVFIRRGGNIQHFYSSELMFAKSKTGQQPRHVDLIWPLWNLFDLTPEGRGTDWYPKLSYGK
ncbi:MAG: DUF899 family protein [Burkholderiales bacterium]